MVTRIAPQRRPHRPARFKPGRAAVPPQPPASTATPSSSTAPAGGRPERKKHKDTPAAVERELKFGVPRQNWAELVRQMQGPDVRTVHMHATYYDTPRSSLAAAGIGLRIRQEGERWVQTAKAAGRHAHERIEDEVVIDVAPGHEPPAPDPSLHARAMRHALQDAIDGPLGPAFEVTFERRVRQVVEDGSVLELAVDEGVIRAAGRNRQIHELEIELKEGRFSDALKLARRWRERHSLWISASSKAERGHRLMAGEPYAAPATASTPRYGADAGNAQMLTAVLRSCLDHIIGNAGEIGAGSHAVDHVHQLRVGIRRLRTALRELPGLRTARRRHEPALIRVFRMLGEERDRSHVLTRIAPLAQAAGGPAVRVPPGFHDGPPPDTVVRNAAFQDALLALLALAEDPPKPRRDHVRRDFRAALEKLQHQVTHDGARYTRLDPARQHRVRKRLKRLRYLSEFAACAFDGHDVDSFIGALKPSQDVLGEYNDELKARDLFEELASRDAGAKFAIEWLRERQPRVAKACQRALKKMAEAPVFWGR